MSDMNIKIQARQLEAELMARDGDLAWPLQGQQAGLKGNSQVMNKWPPGSEYH